MENKEQVPNEIMVALIASASPVPAPCPFCGAGALQQQWHEEAELTHEDGRVEMVTDYVVSCGVCGARGGLGRDEAAALRAWNDRGLMSRPALNKLTS